MVSPFIAGMMVLAAVTPHCVHAANANLFVSAENSQFDNYMSGPQVIEVVVIDSDIIDTDEAKGEPDVSVNGRILRMVQAVDGRWYGYFADRNQVLIADSTTTVERQGLDYGVICPPTVDLGNATSGTTVLVTDTVGVALPDVDDVDGGLDNGNANGGAITVSATITDDDDNFRESMNVVRESKDMNMQHPPGAEVGGQIGLDPDFWPFIQLFALNPTGNVVVQYNKGGGVQSTTLTFDTVDQFAETQLDGSTYPQNAEVHATIADLWLNIDPTDEDSWTFGTFGTLSTNYQVFDENGSPAGDAVPGGVIDISNRLDDLMCEDNGVLIFHPDVQNAGGVATLQDNEDTVLIATPGSNPDDPFSWQTSSGATHLTGAIPITITEQGPNSGVFATYDESDVSVLRITQDAKRGTSASLDYNESPVTILVSFDFATIDIQPVDDIWNSGEEIPFFLVDGDANKNSRRDEDLDLFNPDVDLIPAITIGNPFTLETLAGATLGGHDLVIDDVQRFSQRAMLRVDGPEGGLVFNDGAVLELTLNATFADLFQTIHDPAGNFAGANLFHYDVRSIERSLAGHIHTIDIAITDGQHVASLSSDDVRGLLDLANVTGIFGMAPSAPVKLLLNFAFSGSHSIPEQTVLPIVCDFFSYGRFNDGLTSAERISNMIARIEAEETGDNTSMFEGAVEFFMLNQLTISSPETADRICSVGDDVVILVPEDMTDADAIRANYFDLGADGVSTQIADQEEAPTHSGTVSFDSSSYKPGDTVTVTVEDHDLNTDSDLIDIYVVVSSSDFPDDPARDTIGEPGLGVFNQQPLGAFGRVVDISFDNRRWASGLTVNGGACAAAGAPDDGLFATGFSLIETGTSTGVFRGDFQIPDTVCNSVSGQLESTVGSDLEVNYVDYSDVSGNVIEVGDSAGVRANTGSVSFDRVVYPVPFGTVQDFFPGLTESDSVAPNGRSIFPVHETAVTADADQNIDAGTEEIGTGELIVHIRVNDPDFDRSAAGEDSIAVGDHGPVTISVIRGSETVVLATAGGVVSNSGVITVGNGVIPGVTRELGPITEIAPDAGIFEIDVPIRYTDGPAGALVPDTPDAGFASLNGQSGVLGRFDTEPGVGDFGILQGDIIQVQYTDPADASGDENTVTDSATFDLRNGVLQSNVSVFTIGADMILTLIEPDLDLDNDRAESYSLDLVEWNSASARTTIGILGGEIEAFDPQPLVFRETGDSTGIFQTVVEIPEVLMGNHLQRGEEIRLTYTDWGGSGADFVGQESDDVDLTIFTSNFGATVELDQQVYTWTDRVFITVIAPDHNFNAFAIDTIGDTGVDPITIATRNAVLNQYRLVETGTDTGIFTGSITLTGFLHDADGNPATGDATGFDTSPATNGSGPTGGRLEAERDDGITVQFEFSANETIVDSALIRWNLGEVHWAESEFPEDGEGTLRVVDPDMNLNPSVFDTVTAHVSSDSDPVGSNITLIETNTATGVFESDILFSSTLASSAQRLHVQSGDTITAQYRDATLPDPFAVGDVLSLSATAIIGSDMPLLQRVTAENPRLTDVAGTVVDNVVVGQQVAITADLINNQTANQAFAFIAQVLDEDAQVVSLAWISGNLTANQGFSPSLFWTPDTAGRFDIAVFTWTSVNAPDPLASPLRFSVTVHEDDSNAASGEGATPGAEGDAKRAEGNELPVAGDTPAAITLHDDITVEADHDSYFRGDTVHFSGSLPAGADIARPVTLRTFNPGSNLIFVEQIDLVDALSFSVSLAGDGRFWAVAGVYAAVFDHGDRNTVVNFNFDTGERPALMEISLAFTDEDDVAVNQLALNEAFRIHVFAQDLRDDGAATGVFSAFADVLYDTTLIDVTDLVAVFSAFPSGAIDDVNGIVDEAGGVNNVQPIDRSPQEVFFLEGIATGLGTLDVVLTAAQNIFSENALFGHDDDVREFTNFGDQSIVITDTDLVGVHFDVDPDIVAMGQTTVTFTIENLGSGPAPAFDVAIVLSDDSFIGNEDDVVVKTVDIAGLAGHASVSETVDLEIDLGVLIDHALASDPAGPVAGQQSAGVDFLGLRIDVDDRIVEFNESNNNNLGRGVDTDDITFFPWDVNPVDGVVTPTDAIFVINRLGELSPPAAPVADTNGDGAVTPIDAVRVVNRIGLVINAGVVEASSSGHPGANSAGDQPFSSDR